MMNIKGIGPKKINTIWKEMEIETVGELLYACKENKLSKLKASQKIQKKASLNPSNFINFRQGIFLYAQVEEIAVETVKFLKKLFGIKQIEITGAFLRNEPKRSSELEYVIPLRQKRRS